MRRNRGDYDYVLTKKVSDAVRRVYKGICQYCMAENAMHVDHIIPRSQGGADNLGNFILSCASCNQRKSSGQIAPQYVGLITAIADRNKDRVRAAIREKRVTAIRIGPSPDMYWTIPLSKPPTMQEFRTLETLTNLLILAKANLRAKQENRSQAVVG